jgi:hypothetical protein
MIVLFAFSLVGGGKRGNKGSSLPKRSGTTKVSVVRFAAEVCE